MRVFEGEPISDSPVLYTRVSVEPEYRPKINLAAGFHDYGVLWTPDALVFCLDGIAYLTIETQGTVNPRDRCQEDRPPTAASEYRSQPRRKKACVLP